ncbi:MAG: tetratricopeptide repeat protein, partial [Chthoniobacterales bacterium]
GRLAKALAEAEEALRLQPNLGEGRLALAHYYYWGVNDLDRALAELARAGELIPNSADVWSMRASLYRRQGKIRERIAALQQAEILDPSNTKNRADLGGAFFLVRNWAEGIRTRSRIRAELPDPKPFPWGITVADFRRTGVLDPLKKLIAEVPPGEGPEELTTLRWGRYHVAMLERNYAAAERFLREIPAGETGQSKLMAEAFLEVARGADPAVAERALVKARQEIEKLLADDSADPLLQVNLGLIDAFRGRKEDAIREGRRAVELRDDPLEKNDASAALALIYARTGESDEAIKLIEKLLTLPATMGTYPIFTMAQADLKWRWVWDPLRSDARFQKILEEPEPKTI